MSKKIKTAEDIPQSKAYSLLKFTQFVAGLEKGCAPSAGYMMGIIEKAEKALNDEFTSEALKQLTDNKSEDKRSDLEALISLNAFETFKVDHKNFVKKLADDVLEQFTLTYNVIENA